MSLFSSNAADSNSSDDYFKITDGETIKIRILSDQFVEGWQYFTIDKKVRRFPDYAPPNYAEYVGEISPDFEGKPGSPRPYAAVVIYNYQRELVQVWTISQKTIVLALEALQQDEDFGDWPQYDIKINRARTDGKVTYSCVPLSARPLSPDIIAKIKAKPCNLKALWENKNPFKSEPEPQSRPVNLVPENADDIPF